jgi:hypothetical protein
MKAQLASWGEDEEAASGVIWPSENDEGFWSEH